MFLIASPRGTFLTDEGLGDDRFAVWSFDRRRAGIFTRDEYDLLRRRWKYLDLCDLVPALLAPAMSPDRKAPCTTTAT